MARGTRTIYPGKRNKGLNLTFQPPEEGRSVQRSKRCDKHGDKNLDNSPKNVNNVHNIAFQKYRKIILQSLNRDTNFFDVVAGFLPGDTLTPYLFINYLDYVLWTSKDQIKKKLLYVKKISRSRQYPAENIKGADYANTPAAAEYLLLSLK